ncbi:MAG: hypothetical protein DI556_02305 [Rhodovulum sulfidophilum]|uniref:Uncharacterized protein n=1 Tax=Rhodovulum sulfidophilum TaxID=35806 RepID=A0A2W5NHH9_RHOSU|nr:MAG: hypothetical protein DI556_02305 [Rhodovulum sulfidophilum]
MRALRGGLLACVLSVVLILGLAVQLGPALPPRAAPDAATAGATRDLVTTLRDVMDAEAATGEITLPLAQIRALLTSGERIQRGFRAEAGVDGDALTLRGSVGAPLLPGPLWLNPSLTVAASDEGLRIEHAALGYLPLPPALVRWGIAAAIDRALGPGLGKIALGAITRLEIDPERVTVSYAMSDFDREVLFARVKERVRGFAGETDVERVYAHLWFLDRAGGRQRALPRRGSFVPYLRHVVARAEGPGDMKAALLALTLYCGESALGPAVGAYLSPAMQGNNHCERTTLGGRDDLKRHFVVSAGIYAARSGEVAFGMGEFKELLDTNEGGSGFSFDDMAADLAGARFAELVLGTPPEGRAALIARIDSEADVLPPLEGLPTGLPEAEFRARFGGVESPAYQAMIAEINARLDAMPLYGGAGGDG